MKFNCRSKKNTPKQRGFWKILEVTAKPNVMENRLCRVYRLPSFR